MVNHARLIRSAPTLPHSPTVAPSTPWIWDRTDRFAGPHETRYERVEGGTIARTPVFPTYAFGHRLILDQDLHQDELAYAIRTWRAAHARARKLPKQIHICWPGDEIAPAELPRCVVSHALRLVAIRGALEASAPRSELTSVELVPVTTPAAWAQAARISADVFGADLPLSRWLYAMYRARVEARQGVVWMAYMGGVPAGVAGVFLCGQEARLQDVAVLPTWRRVGVASALIRCAAAWVAARSPSALLASIPDPTSEAARALYAGLGFHEVERASELVIPTARASAITRGAVRGWSYDAL